jgi:hypothetical protein
MVIKKTFKRVVLLCLFIIVSVSFFFPALSCLAASDVGIVVEKVELKENEKIDICRYCGKLINTGSIHSDAEKIVKEKLLQALTQRGTGYRDGKEKQPYISVLIYRFQERKGGNLAIDKPAGVGLHMHLIQGTIVGRTFVFDEDQKALSQDILHIGKFFSRGGKWITADKLAEEGINKGTDYLLEILQ